MCGCVCTDDCLNVFVRLSDCMTASMERSGKGAVEGKEDA